MRFYQAKPVFKFIVCRFLHCVLGKRAAAAPWHVIFKNSWMSVPCVVCIAISAFIHGHILVHTHSCLYQCPTTHTHTVTHIHISKAKADRARCFLFFLSRKITMRTTFVGIIPSSCCTVNIFVSRLEPKRTNCTRSIQTLNEITHLYIL